ncbi:HAD-IA family hydrolase [Candidatus Woesearchaeota archaeon]|nr:HAD-IA family hydrolase [Candidatus Woesearchaeota archaeon]
MSVLLLLDLDGTLIDTHKHHCIISRKVLRIMNKRCPKKLTHNSIYFLLQGFSSIERSNFWNEYNTIDNREYTNDWKVISLFSDTISFLDFCKCLDIAIVTDTPERKAWRELNHFGINKYFRAVVCSGTDGLEKPEATMVLKAMSLLNSKPSHIFLIGDSVLDFILAENLSKITQIPLKLFILDRYNESLKIPISPRIKFQSVKSLLAILPHLKLYLPSTKTKQLYTTQQ